MKIIPSLFTFVGDPLFGVKTKLESESLVKLILKKIPEYRTLVFVGNVLSTKESLKFLKKFPHNIILVVNAELKSILISNYRNSLPENLVVVDELRFKYEKFDYKVTPIPSGDKLPNVNIHGSKWLLDSDICSYINVGSRYDSDIVTMQDISTGTFK